MPESTQHKLDRVRPPRVQITYDVETGGAIQKKELPLVMGILADLSGKPENPLPKLKDRKFVEIDRDNFNAILKSIAPRTAMQVDNKLSKEGGKTNIELKFQSIDDFSPLNIVQQVPALNELFKARQRLNDLLAKLDGNDKLDSMLRELKDDEVKQLQGMPEQSEQHDAAKGGN
jgi:type VI secretion system protein ImpB